MKMLTSRLAEDKAAGIEKKAAPTLSPEEEGEGQTSAKGKGKDGKGGKDKDGAKGKEKPKEKEKKEDKGKEKQVGGRGVSRKGL